VRNQKYMGRLVLSVLFVFGSRAAVAQVSCTPYTDINQVISQSGNYCFTRNIVVNTAAQLSIRANNVTLDLRGFTLQSNYVPPENYYASAISGIGDGITVKNGTITGFPRGISLGASEKGKLLIDNITVINAFKGDGIAVFGPDSTVRDSTVSGTRGCLTRAISAWGNMNNNDYDGPVNVRNNLVIDTRATGSTFEESCPAFGIHVRNTRDASIHNNKVRNTTSDVGGPVVGIYIDIDGVDSLGAVDVWNNKVSNAVLASPSVAIGVINLASNAVVRDSVIENFDTGIKLFPSEGAVPLYLYNTITGAITPFDGDGLMGPGNETN